VARSRLRKGENAERGLFLADDAQSLLSHPDTHQKEYRVKFVNAERKEDRSIEFAENTENTEKNIVIIQDGQKSQNWTQV
jgi:hypothetical protein